MILSIDDIIRRYIQLYNFAYPDSQNKETGMAFMEAHFDEIKEEVSARILIYLRRADSTFEDPQVVTEYVELACRYAFGNLAEALKIR